MLAFERRMVASRCSELFGRLLPHLVVPLTTLQGVLAPFRCSESSRENDFGMTVTEANAESRVRLAGSTQIPLVKGYV